MADVYLTRFEFTASGLSKVTSQFTGMANGMKAKAASAGAAIGKALTGPIAAAMATMAAGMGLIGVTKEFMSFESASSAAVARLGLNVSRTAEQIRADLKAGLDVSVDESKYVKALDNVQGIQRELGASTKFTATEVGQGIENIAAMGGDVLNMTSQGMKPFLDLSAATNYSLDETANVLMSTLRQFSLYDAQLTNSTRVADVFSKACGMSSLDMSKLSTAMNYAGPVMNSLGVSLEETTAYLAMAANAGYDGSMSGTALRGAMVRLLLPTKATSDAVEQLGKDMGLSDEEMDEFSEGSENIGAKLQKLGLTMSDLNPETTSLYDILIKLKDAGASTGDIMEIFGMRAGPVMLAMMNQLGDFPGFFDQLQNAAGSSTNMAAQQLDNLKGAITILKSALSDLAIELGSYLAPGLRRLAEWLTSTGVPAIKSFFQAIHEGDYNAAIEKLGQFINFAGEKLIGGLRYIVEGIANIIKSIDWAGLFIGLITFISELPGKVATELSNLVTYIRNNLSTIDLSSVGQNISEAFRTAGQNAVQNLLKQFELLRNVGSLYVDLAKSFYSAFMNVDFAVLGKEIAYKLGQSMLNAARNIKNIGKAISDAILNINWRSLGSNFGNKLSGALTTGRGDLSGKFKEIFQDLPNAIRELDWQDAFQRSWDDILEGVTDVTSAIKEAFSEMLKGIIGDSKFEEIASKFEDVKDRIKNIIDSIKEAFDGVWDSIKDKATSTFASVKESFGSAFEEMRKTADTVREVLGRLFDENKEKADGFIITIGQIIAKFVEWGGSAVIGALGLALEGLALILKGVFWVVNEMLIPVFSKLFTWLEPVIITIIDKFKWFYEAIKNVIKIAADMHNEYGSIFNGIKILMMEWVNAMNEMLKNFIIDSVTQITVWGKNFATSIKRGLGEAILAFATFAEDALSAIGSVTSSLKNLIGLQQQSKMQTATQIHVIPGDGSSPYSTSYSPHELDSIQKVQNRLGGQVWVSQVGGQKIPVEISNMSDFDAIIANQAARGGTVQVASGDGWRERAGSYVSEKKEQAVDYVTEKGERAWDYVSDPIVTSPDGTQYYLIDDPGGINEKDLKERGIIYFDPETGKQQVDSSRDISSYTSEVSENTSETNSLLTKLMDKGKEWAETPYTTFEAERPGVEQFFGWWPDKLFELDPESKNILRKTEEGTEIIISLDKEKIEIGELTAWELEKLNKEVSKLESLPELTEEQKEKVGDIKKALDDAADKLASEGKDSEGKDAVEKAPEGTYPQRLHSSSLGYIQQIEALQAQGLAHVKSIAHKEMLKEQFRESLAVAESQGITVDAKIANIVGYELLSPIEVDAEVKDIEVDKKAETVELDADLSLDEESKFSVVEEIQAVEPEIESSTYLNNESLQNVVKTVEAVRPQVGVDFYINTPITWPSSVNIGVNFYPLNSPAANVPSSNDMSLQKFDSGGYTGRYSGPAWVDPEEVILNKAQQLGIIKSLTGNNKGIGEVHIHYDLRNTIITGFKDVDDFISYSTEKTIKEINRRQGTI